MSDQKDKTYNAAGAYATLAMMDEAGRYPKTGVIKTTKRGIEESKEFVEENQK